LTRRRGFGDDTKAFEGSLVLRQSRTFLKLTKLCYKFVEYTRSGKGGVDGDLRGLREYPSRRFLGGASSWFPILLGGGCS